MVFGALISLVNVSADLGVAFNAWQMSALQECVFSLLRYCHLLLNCPLVCIASVGTVQARIRMLLLSVWTLLQHSSRYHHIPLVPLNLGAQK